MKVEVKEEEDRMYPYLGLNHNTIVLFTSPKTGTRLTNSDGCGSYLGEHSNDWHEQSFTPLNGSVTLSNS
jgi:hypothetical protein